MDRVVKCKSDQCAQYFMYTKEDTKCPFCHTEYSEVEEKIQVEYSEAEENTQEEDEDVKTEKESFKIWKSNPKKEIKKKLK